MQAIMESVFDITYLVVALTLGVMILRKANKRNEILLFGIMTIVLACGDAFHLVPRIMALNATSIVDYTAALGFGTLVTSITMTVFYVMLYHVWRLRYRIKGKSGLTAAIYILAVIRIAICLFPQNDWLSAETPLNWAIYRNIPFVILGIIIIVLYFTTVKERKDRAFRFMWLAITLSFMFYIPVVLFVDTVPIIGMLMLPKTCAYVWIICMGYKDYKKLWNKSIFAVSNSL